jgi:predicted transcriptional regulator
MEKLMTQANKVLKALESGEALTAAQMTARYGVKNPHEVVRLLRTAGYAIYMNKEKNSKGETTNKYRLGKPTRAIVAAGIAALGSQALGPNARKVNLA